MSLYAVIRDAGPEWLEGVGAFEQPGANDHAAYMNLLATEGFLLCAGPLAGTEAGRLRVLAVVEATSEDEIHRRLADDPWVVSRRLDTSSVSSWTLVVGEQRLRSDQERAEPTTSPGPARERG